MPRLLQAIVLACVAAAALVVVAPQALARGSVSLDSALMAAGGDVYLGGVLEGRVALGPGAVRLQLPGAWTSHDDGAALGALALGYALPVSRTAQITPTITVPLRAFDDSGGPDADHRALAVARAMYGLRDPWLWRPEDVAIALAMGSASPLGAVVVRQELAVALLIPAGGRGEDLQAVIQGGVSVGLPFADRFVVALGGHVVSVIGEDTQISLEPSFSARLGPGTEIGVALTVNLDAPFGFAFDDDGFWGLHLAVVQVIP